MLTVAVDVSLLLPLLFTSVWVNKPASNEPLMNMSLFCGVLMMPDSTVSQSLVPVVSGIRTRSAVSKVTLDEGTPAAWLVDIASGRARLSASIPIRVLLLVFIRLFPFHLEPAFVKKDRDDRL